MSKSQSSKKSSKNLFYSVLTIAIAMVIVLAASEIMVRMLVSKEIYFPISNIYTKVGPTVGYTYKPNFKGTAFGVDLRTNSLGFRGPEWGKNTKPGDFRIALIGDSHAFGYGVPFGKTVGERLGKYLEQKSGHQVEVLNFGVNGYNSDQQLAVLRRYALEFSPSLILLIPCSNDHEEALEVDRQGYLRKKDQTLVNDNSIFRLSSETFTKIVPYSRLAIYLVFLKKKFAFKNALLASEPPQYQSADINMQRWWMGDFEAGPVPRHLVKTVYLPLKSVILEAKSHGIPIIIANFNAMLGFRRLFQNISREEDIPSIELLSLFPEASNWQELLQKFGLGWNDHLGAIAHERWARAIGDIVLENGYIKLNSGSNYTKLH